MRFFFLLVPLRSAFPQAAPADAADMMSDARWQAHVVHVAPHLIVFDPQHHATVLTFSNTGETPLDAEVMIQLGYTNWQNTDTVLFSPHWATEAPVEDPNDTVIANPGLHEHYAGQWLSGVPTHVHLAPHQTQRVTLRITPPPGTPNGEYYARIVTLVYPPRRGGHGQDTQHTYALPVSRAGPPLPRDSVRVFYRQGPQAMRVRVMTAAGQIDTTTAGNDTSTSNGIGQHALRLLLQVHLAGPTHFEGYLDCSYLLADGQKVQLSSRGNHKLEAITIHRDGVLRQMAQTSALNPGHYTLIMRFIPWQDEFPPDQRVPADTAQVQIPFDVP